MNKKEYCEFLLTQGPKYIWHFTKQESHFDKVINANKIFAEWKYNTERKVSLEDYYAKNSIYYNIENRHRTLIISQLYGLLTKNSPYYRNEDVTPAYKNILNVNNIEDYNKFISEQILKIKIPAITDSRNINPTDRCIFPVLFIYKVLNALIDKGIKSISIDELFLFVMTQNIHDDISISVSLILKEYDYINDDIKELIKNYKDLSRILSVLKNLDLFKFDEESITINLSYKKGMDEFIENNEKYFLKNNLDYNKFLCESQDFNLSLIERLNNPVIDSIIEIKEDNQYILDINKVEIKPDKSEISSNHLLEPVYLDIQTFKSKRDVKLGKYVIVSNNYKCSYDETHLTFISKSTNNNYVEAHHLIPIQFQEQFWQDLKINIDAVQNIIALCPTCHRALHYGITQEKKRILKVLFDKQKNKLEEININIDKIQLIGFYV